MSSDYFHRACLSRSEFKKIVVTGRGLLQQRKLNYRGLLFEQDLSELSSVPFSKIEAVLGAPEEKLGGLLTGLEWERVLSAARVYPEDLLAAAGLKYDGVVAPTSSYAASSDDNPPPSMESDQRIRALFDLMSDFFLEATRNVVQPGGATNAAVG